MKDKNVISIKDVNNTKVTISEVHDGLENLIAQLGTAQDKRNAGKFVNNKQLSLGGNREELDALYQTDWLSAKLVDIIPNDMTREWRTFDGDIEPEQVTILEEEENRIDLVGNFNFANKWARLYGTAFIIMAVDDGQTPDKPLNLNRIKKGGLQHIKVIDRHRMFHQGTIITDPFNPNFGLPEFYTPTETSIRIHHSRVLRFDGVMLPFDLFRRNNYNGNSILDRIYESILNFNTAVNSAASMIYETNVDIIQMKNLMQHLQTAEGETLVRKRITLMNQLKSFNNALILDSEENFQTKNNTFAGLPDLIDRFSQILSAAGDVPATRLLGSSASGLNATGEGDLKNYYDNVSSMQEKDYKPKLDYFDHIMAASLGMGFESDLSYEFNSLFQLSDTEQSTIDLQNAQRDTIYLDQTVVTTSIVAKDLKQNKTYTNITDEYIAELEAFENEEIDETENAFTLPSSEFEEVEEQEEVKKLSDVFGVK